LCQLISPGDHIFTGSFPQIGKCAGIPCKRTSGNQTAQSIAIAALRLYNIDVNDEETRLKILKVLHSFYKDKPMNFLKTEALVNQIGHGDREVLSHLDYLLDAGYIQGKKFKTFESGGYLEKVKITRKGLNVVEPASTLPGQQKSDLIDTMMANLITNVLAEVERADISEDEKKNLLEEISKFLTNPYIAPFVGAALLKLLESA
jgi:hypothetical protein